MAKATAQGNASISDREQAIRAAIKTYNDNNAILDRVNGALPTELTRATIGPDLMFVGMDLDKAIEALQAMRAAVGVLKG